MSFYGSRVVHYIEGANEEDVRLKLFSIGLELDQKIEMINVYHNAAKGKVFAWYFHDTKAAPLPKPQTDTKVTKKKKKILKKA